MFDRFLSVFFSSTKMNNMGMTRCVTEVHTSLPSARVWWPTTAIRQHDINLLILDLTFIILN